MGDFNRSNRSGERRGFGSRSGSERPMMHQAVCSSCGKTCEVPFRPTGSKPVYCRDCFQKTGPDTNRSEGRRFERSGSDDRQMFDAVCSNCGDNCKLPFQPRQGKPVFCSRCFEKNEGSESRGSDRPRFESRSDSRPARSNDQPNYKAQFEALNAKMDKILALLSPEAPIAVETDPVESVLNEEIIDELVEEVREEKPKKAKAAPKASKSKATAGKKKATKTRISPAKKSK